MWAVEMTFDVQGERSVREVWERVEDIGIRSLASVPNTEYRPHVTLAVFNEADAGEIEGALGDVVKPMLGSELVLASAGFFVAGAVVAFLGVTPSQLLLETHRQVHAALEDVVRGSWPHYTPGLFVPHCTIAMSVDDTSGLVEVLRGDRLPIRARVQAVGLIEISTGATIVGIA